MLTSKVASRRLKMPHDLIDDIFNKLGIDDKLLFRKLDEEYEIILAKYLNEYVVKISREDLRRLVGNHKTIKELILAIACIKGSALVIEPIWIIFKIIDQGPLSERVIKI